jgi:hypothetical protein
MKSWVFTAALLFGTSAIAQLGPNDIELRAAYCVPVVQAGIRFVDSMTGKVVGSTDAVSVRVFAELTQHRQKLDSDLTRLQAYVLPKLMGDRGDGFLLGFAAATERGSADVDLSAASVRSCANTCPVGDSQCVEVCVGREPANRRVAACHSLDWLPF